jgi:hypothetical protein
VQCRRMKQPNVKDLFRPSLFWDAGEVDVVKHAAYIIARILDYGDVKDVRVLMDMYADEKIIKVIRTRRGLSPKTGKYWAVKFGIPVTEVACLRKYYPREQ